MVWRKCRYHGSLESAVLTRYIWLQLSISAVWVALPLAHGRRTYPETPVEVFVGVTSPLAPDQRTYAKSIRDGRGYLILSFWSKYLPWKHRGYLPIAGLGICSWAVGHTHSPMRLAYRMSWGRPPPNLIQLLCVSTRRHYEGHVDERLSLNRAV